MVRFLLLGLLALFTAQAARAQTVTEQRAPIAPSQMVLLNLKFANTIRVRPATDGQLRVRATVNINQNTLNDAFQLNLSRTDSQLTVTSNLDTQRLAQAQSGNCPDSASWYYGGKNSARVCADIVCEVTLPANTSMRISTINGNVEVQGLTGELYAKSISGFVDVSWPANRSAQVALKSITGEVYTSPSVAFQQQQRYSSPVGYEVRGSLRGGTGPALRLESISGDVFFREAR
ncbi:DUF4097 family beta strand repeat-containing protein [Hymenobacter metallilatus]|uniref:Adhesin domain-containing protein n=1 Tax=Hymenobacter metallilatus TaxID=2493666 RepID=A0A3R9NT43_9BACT|nr:hypothetical protein [Hymenobacter metallilatus]RSK37110.1 hypothetical protein EI290_00130 [Hymenobacter metallilatus]